MRVLEARSLFARLIGLLGTVRHEHDSALWLRPCHSVHTFGMKYPIDIVMLDRNGRVVRILPSFRANQIADGTGNTASVIELPDGAVNAHGIEERHILQVEADAAFRPRWDALRNLFHWPVNFVIAFLWSRLVMASLAHWNAHHDPMQLGVLIHNTLLMLFFLTRRKSVRTSTLFRDWAVPALTMASAMLLRPVDTFEGVLLTLSGYIQYIGIAGMIFSLMSLGRSFGIVPANRRVVSSGAYRFVRHPLYLSEIIFYTGFFLGNVTLNNFMLIVFLLAGQLWRSLSEEQLLSRDANYQAYAARVRFRFLPGVF